MTSSLPKVYIYPAGRFFEDYVMVALHEDGDWNLSHVCSHPGFAYYDLHTRREGAYKVKFGGFGDGKFYQVIQCEAADDIPLQTLVAAGMRRSDGSRVTGGPPAHTHQAH